ncbi:MAG TPA: helix-turn-helix transcriptional regulator [Actinocrinis sp.]|nr:helix-turn-helix transcriptional regulator [Actinocrinis sp.]
MAGGASPLVRGRRLATRLRSLRLAAGRTVEEAAVHLECSAAKVSRIENAVVGVRIQDARELLDLYGVAAPVREEVLDLVRQARTRGWWFPYLDVMPPGFDQVLALEDEAATISMLETRLVPGLFQTTAYVAELMGSLRDEPPERGERRIDLRMRRQQLLTRSDAPTVALVLDEAVLRRRFCADQAMTEQYRRLFREAQAPNVSVRVLPLSARVHQAAGFSFTVFGFADPADPKLVYEELFSGSVVQESAEKVGRYTAAFEQAAAAAWSEDESLDRLAELAGERR